MYSLEMCWKGEYVDVVHNKRQLVIRGGKKKCFWDGRQNEVEVGRKKSNYVIRGCKKEVALRR